MVKKSLFFYQQELKYDNLSFNDNSWNHHHLVANLAGL